MRHRVQGRKLGRTTAHRTAMFRNQLTALFTHDRIVTTVAKAKELRPLAERMVTLARTGSLPARRKVLTMVPDKDVVRRLFDDIAPRFMDRPGGYTRIMRLGRRRGDGAEMAIIEFVDYDLSEHDEGATPSKSKTSLMDRAKGMFGGGAKAASEEASEEPAAQLEAVETAPEDEPAEEPEAVETAPEDEPAEEPQALETALTEEPVEEPEAVDTAPAEEPDKEPEAVKAAPAEEPPAEPEAVETAAEEEPVEEPKAEEAAPVEEPVEGPETAVSEPVEETVEEAETSEAEAADETDEETKKS